MIQGWILVFSAKELFQVKIAEDVLKQNGIESHIVSKPDSVIPSLGEAELYTPADRAEEAIRILVENNIKE